MASSGDEMSDALSAAVGAHLNEGGDLRHEIVGSVSELSAFTQASSLTNKPFQSVGVQDGSLTAVQRQIRPLPHFRYSDYPPQLGNEFTYAAEFSPNLHSNLMQKRSAQFHEEMHYGRFDERHVLHASRSSPQISTLHDECPSNRNMKEQYDVGKARFPQQGPLYRDEWPPKRDRPPPPPLLPQQHRLADDRRHRPVEGYVRDEPRFPVRNDHFYPEAQHPRNLASVRFHGSHQPRDYWEPSHKPPSDMRNMWQESQPRESLPSYDTSRRGGKSARKRFSRSRVNEEPEEEKSFDDILQQHKRNQREMPAHPRESHKDEISNAISNRIKQVRSGRISESFHEEQSSPQASSFGQSTNPDASIINIEGSKIPVGAFIQQAVHALLLSSEASNSAAIPPASPDNNNSDKALSSRTEEYERFVYDNEQSQVYEHDVVASSSPQLETLTYPPSPKWDRQEDFTYLHNDDDDETVATVRDEAEDASLEDDDDEEEELLNLRLAALSSAYSRNVEQKDIDDELSVTEEDKDTKPNKLKKKKTKEKKKYSKKDRTSLQHDTKTKSTKLVTRLSRGKYTRSSSPKERLKSPVKDFSDPKILTLGNEVMKKKTLQEQEVLRDIRKINDPEEGTKKFMDLMKTKRERAMKKSKKETTDEHDVASQADNLDNYDEVEMEVENSSNKSDPVVMATSIVTEDADNLNICDVDEVLEQPPPPGTDADADSIHPNQTVGQESIWDLLDEPLKPSCSSETAADKLISSIRAITGVDSAHSNIISEPNTTESVPFTKDPMKSMPLELIEKHEDSNWSGVDSPEAFQHAFEPTVISDPYPAMATELSCLEEDDMTTDALDGETLNYTVENEKQPQKDEDSLAPTLSQAALPEEELDTSEVERNWSLEDEEALREKLLKDLAVKRQVFEKSQSKAVVQPIDALPEKTQQPPLLPLPQPPPLLPQPPLLPLLPLPLTRLPIPMQERLTGKSKTNAKKLAKQMRLLKKRQRAKRWKREREKEVKLYRKFTGDPTALPPLPKKLSKTKARLLKQPVSIQQDSELIPDARNKNLIPVQSSKLVDDILTSQPVAKIPPPRVLPPVSCAAPPLINLSSVTSHVITHSTSYPALTQYKSNASSASVLPNTVSVTKLTKKEYPAKQSVPAAKLIAKQQRKSTVSNQLRLLHPPVVIDLNHSSDEEDHVPPPKSRDSIAFHASSYSPQRPPARSSPVPLTNVDGTSIALTTVSDTIRKRKMQLSTTDAAKVSRITLAQSKATNSSRKVREEGCTDRTSQVTGTVKSSEVSVRDYRLRKEKATQDLVIQTGKLQKLKELLFRDKAVVSRSHQQKQSKLEELQACQEKADDLRKQLAEIERNIAVMNDAVKKLNSKTKEVVSTMEKRKKLESRYLVAIERLKKTIQDVDEYIEKSDEKGAAGDVIPTLMLEEKPNEQPNSPRTDVSTEKPLPMNRSPKPVEPLKAMPRSSSSPDLRTLGLTANSGAAKKTTTDVSTLSENPREKPSSPLKVNLKANLEKKKVILLEKARELTLQTEKARLQQTEMKLNLIRQRGKQNVRSSPIKNNLTAASSHTVNPTMSYEATKRRSAAYSPTRAKPESLPVSANKVEKMAKKVSLKLPASETHAKFDDRTSPETNFSATRQPTAEMEHEVTPVTPILKRRRTKSSSSGPTTPLTSGTGGFDSLPLSDSSLQIELPTLSSEQTSNLKKKLPELFSKPVNFTSENTEFAPMIRMFATPDCFSEWKVELSEVSRQAVKTCDRSEEPISKPDCLKFVSPLRNFRSYRLNRSFRSQEKTSFTSATFSHKIHVHQILCRYGLTGKCHDSKCRAQHLKDILLSPNEIFLDLLWYCPTLLKTSEGKQVSASDPLDVQLKAAEYTVQKLCGRNRKSNVSVEETCILLVDVINRALGNKDPHTLVFGKRPKIQHFDAESEDIDDNDVVNPDSQESELHREGSWTNMIDENASANDPEIRYFVEEDKCRGEIERLTSLLKSRPKDELLRVQLAQTYFSQTKNDNRSRSMELALHTLCIGIELNEQSELLWSTYIPMLRRHHKSIATTDELEIVDQSLVLLPLSKPVWNEVFKWDWPIEKLDSYYQQLIENLVTRDTIWRSPDYIDLASQKRNFTYYSSWLLRVVVERCHLLRFARGKHEAKNSMLETLKSLDEALKKRAAKESDDNFPLSEEDLSKLWLIYIYFTEYGKLPATVYDDSFSSHMFGMSAEIGEVVISFPSSRKLVQKEEMLQALFKKALQSLSQLNGNRVSRHKLTTYQSMVNLETFLTRFNAVEMLCKSLIDSLGDQSTTSEHRYDSFSQVDVWVTWTEAVMRSNDVMLVTQTFAEAVTACPQSAKLAYMASIYQLSSDHEDIEATLQYLEACVVSLVDNEGEEDLSLHEVHQLYRRLLKHNLSLKSSTQIKLRNGVSIDQVEKEKPYLWLIYCLLTHLLITHQDENVSRGIEVADLYEAALHVVASPKDTKVIWIQYLLHLRSTAVSVLEEANSSSTGSKAFLNVQKKQLAWLRRLLSVVRRCLSTISSRYNVELEDSFAGRPEDGKYHDYSFHNEVCSIFLSCFNKAQMPVAMTMLTDAMPTNIPLLIRAASFFLREGDHVSVTSMLWRMTSSYTGSYCRDYRVWKMAASALVADGKHAKAIRLYNRAFTAIPRCKILWLEVSLLTLAYGDSSELNKLNLECKRLLGTCLNSLLKDTLDSLHA